MVVTILLALSMVCSEGMRSFGKDVYELKASSRTPWTRNGPEAEVAATTVSNMGVALDFSFEHSASRHCPPGWACTGDAQVCNISDSNSWAYPLCRHVGLSGAEGNHYLMLADDTPIGTATSPAFVLPPGVRELHFRRCGGAGGPFEGSGLYVHRQVDNSILCRAENGADTNVFFPDICPGLDGHAGEVVFVHVRDRVSAGWGKVFVDDLRFVDGSGTELGPLQATGGHIVIDVNDMSIWTTIPATTPSSTRTTTTMTTMTTTMTTTTTATVTSATTATLTSTTTATVTSAATTTTVLPTQGSSYGDPHITTLHGEKFDILRPGTHTYLVVPRGALQKEVQLHVQGKITAVGPTCGDGLFLRGLKISGSWLGQVGSLEFAAWTNEVDTAHTMGIRVDGDTTAWNTLEEKLPRGLVDVQRFHLLPHEQLGRHVDTLRVTLHLGPANLTVGWAHTFRPAVNWLWMEVGGIDDGGGLLGSDDHVWAATRPELCTHAEEGF